MRVLEHIIKGPLPVSGNNIELLMVVPPSVQFSWLAVPLSFRLGPGRDFAANIGTADAPASLC
jgi:hypothetical protein